MRLFGIDFNINRFLDIDHNIGQIQPVPQRITNAERIPGTTRLCVMVTGDLTNYAWSPDGQMLIRSNNMGFAIRNVRDSLTWHDLTVEGVYGVNDIALSPGGKVLTLAHGPFCISLCNAKNGMVLSRLEGHKDFVTSVAWSPKGRFLASGSHDKTVRLWDGQSNTLVRVLEGHTDLVRCVAWSPDGQMLASCSLGRTIHLWDAQTGAMRGTLKGHTTSVNRVAWSPNGQMIAATADNHTLLVWSVQSGDLLHTLTGDYLSWSSDGWLLASQSDTGFCLWRTDTWELVFGEQMKLYCTKAIAFHQSKPLLVTSGLDWQEKSNIWVWQYDIKALLR